MCKNIFKASSISISILALSFLFFALMTTLGCGKKAKDNSRKKELLIYCGITMIRPMSEIAALIENSEKCKIIITKGGSGNLLKSIVHNKAGDLYLPGSEKYYRIIEKKYGGLVVDKVLVGYNKAVILVQKGNPMGIKKNLSEFISKDYGVMIGNPDSGSIGKETKKILEKRGIFKDVIKNAMTLTTDSKDLINAVKNEEADIVINWYATSTWGNNPDHVDVIEIDSKYAKKKRLILGRLKFSKYPEIAKKFMDMASSEKGRAIFQKNGFYFD